MNVEKNLLTHCSMEVINIYNKHENIVKKELFDKIDNYDHFITKKWMFINNLKNKNRLYFLITMYINYHLENTI